MAVSLREVRAALEDLGVAPRKRWGQNFLIDRNVRDFLFRQLGVEEGDRLLEVGPGLGGLTVSLVESQAQVFAVEIDPALCAYLEEQFAGRDNFTLLQGDVLQVELPEATKVVGNLPYYITSPVIFRVLEEMSPEVMLFVVQREVAERLVAGPGGKDYGALSVMVQVFCRVELLRVLPPEVFYPRPRVESAAVRFTPSPDAPDVPPWFLRRVVAAAFQQRRKTLINSLKGSGILRLSEADLVTALRAAGIDGRRRAESFSPADFLSLAREFLRVGAAVEK